MTIIKNGDLTRPDPEYRFECPKCGCIYDAVKSECTPKRMACEAGITKYFYKCPTCSYEVAGREKGKGRQVYGQ